ncbi:excinuclease ABC subunit UvrC [Rickettsiales bacterium]|nr:excinuclease ABC subunit UvrC [Rickettsiales bacterium]
MKFDYKIGLNELKKSLIICPKGPGVYQFINEKRKIIYIGKAKNILNRLRSYLNFNILSNRIKKMVCLIRDVKFIKTHTEVDALLLESNLIKKHKPDFNIRLIDDKSFPFILLDNSSEWTRIRKVRGDNHKNGFLYGPFSSGYFIDKVITILEKGFLLRTCSDSDFNNRKNPCILYQIKRCSAPCVGHINKKDYKELVKEATSFLNGKDSKIRKNLVYLMERSSNKQLYEEAALYRDRIKALSKISQEKYSSLDNKDNFDIICGLKRIDIICVQVFFFRNGKNLGNKEFFFNNQKDMTCNSIIEEFLGIFYLNKIPPSSILINKKIENISLIEQLFKKKKNVKTKISFPQKGKKVDLVNMVEKNIDHSLDKQISKSSQNKELEIGLRDALNLKNIPKRIEVYDNSHLSGTQPTGAMIVYKNNEFSRENYRKFNIRVEGNTTNDDYLMMSQVINRRLDINTNKLSWKNDLPDLIIIDGGKGHLNSVRKIIDEKKLKNIDLISIAKGELRNAGNETIFHLDYSLKFKKNDKILFFLQRLRDEAHRFAISSQRYRRNKLIKQSIFDNIVGIGSKTKRILLSHFGSIENIKSAGIRDLEGAPGVGKKMAKKIYEEFNE